MGEWNDFLLAAAGAAGVLTGLVFVGISINLDKIMFNPSYGLTGRALEALVLLIAVLVVTTLLLVPGQGMVMVGVEILGVGIADWAGIVAIQLLHLRNWQSLEPYLRGHFVTRVVLGQVGHATVCGRGANRIGLGCWRSLLARSRCGSVLLGCSRQCVGTTRRDPSVSERPLLCTLIHPSAW